MLRPLGQFLVFSFLRIFVKLKVEGLQNLKDLQLPAVFMPNHVSYIDPVVVAWALPFKIRKRISFAAGRDVLYEYYWYISHLAEFLGNSFSLPRMEGENIKLGLEYMGQLLDKNYSAVIFPEGRMSETGQLQPLKRGAGFVAVEMNCYVVPVKIYGSAYVLPYGKFMPRHRGEVRIVFGKPLKFRKSDSYDEVTKVIEKALQNL